MKLNSFKMKSKNSDHIEFNERKLLNGKLIEEPFQMMKLWHK